MCASQQTETRQQSADGDAPATRPVRAAQKGVLVLPRGVQAAVKGHDGKAAKAVGWGVDGNAAGKGAAGETAEGRTKNV
jgi:hypothetical protein